MLSLNAKRRIIATLTLLFLGALMLIAYLESAH